MGHEEREHRRLALQASILNPFTEHLLRRAGIAAGMHVLDIGCGVGDVSLLAARIPAASTSSGLPNRFARSCRARSLSASWPRKK